jgi:hypothetical protein
VRPPRRTHRDRRVDTAARNEDTKGAKTERIWQLAPPHYDYPERRQDMAGRKRAPADAAAATDGADPKDTQSASSSKTGARSPAQRPARSRSQTTKAKAGANFGDGNGNGNGTAPSSTTPSAESTISRTHDQPLSEAEVRARAYEIYLSRGGADGDPVADWLAAERQVMGKGSQSS